MRSAALPGVPLARMALPRENRSGGLVGLRVPRRECLRAGLPACSVPLDVKPGREREPSPSALPREPGVGRGREPAGTSPLRRFEPRASQLGEQRAAPRFALP
ncbi:MAG TPA: hypothetical protein VFV02_09830, partial [Acidimicrobiales bacterium]|nr:hypothetical protein [Acidimicrobiales bacterium]